MKRSEVNSHIKWAVELLAKHDIRLPETAYWPPEKWRENSACTETIRRTGLGWDITDFGTGNFPEIGAVLYTVRNGLVDEPNVGVPYCEKYILMKEGQRLPKHYHVFKSEDIIARAGGAFTVYLWNVDRESGLELKTPVKVWMDGIERVFAPGEPISISQGNSITLAPYVAHVFGPSRGSGESVIGEVSKVNDDHTDNYFLEKVSRFADIKEDDPPLHPLCNEYSTIWHNLRRQ